MKNYADLYRDQVKLFSLISCLKESREAEQKNEAYYERLLETKMQEMLAAVHHSRPELADDTARAMFLEELAADVAYLKENLPKDIVASIADMRVLALGEASKKAIFKLKTSILMDRSHDCDHFSYGKYYDFIKDTLPAHLVNAGSFKESVIQRTYFSDNDFTIEITPLYTPIHKMTYQNASVPVSQYVPENCSILFDQIYFEKKHFIIVFCYETLQNTRGVLTIQCSNVIYT